MMIGATDMGTGCDTILSQMAADCMDCDVKDIVVSGVDTDVSPYDSGSYASSTTYVTGMAVVKACKELREKIIAHGAELLGIPAKTADFDGACVYAANEDKANDGSASISLKDISQNVCAVRAWLWKPRFPIHPLPLRLRSCVEWRKLGGSPNRGN